MEYGGITPVGLPTEWRLLLDARVHRDGRRDDRLRRTPLEAARAGPLLADLPGAEVVDDLAGPLAN